MSRAWWIRLSGGGTTAVVVLGMSAIGVGLDTAVGFGVVLGVLVGMIVAVRLP